MAEEKLQGKERTSEELIAMTFEILAGASSCKNCQSPDDEVLELYQTALDNYARNIGGDQGYLSQITDQDKKFEATHEHFSKVITTIDEAIKKDQ